MTNPGLKPEAGARPTAKEAARFLMHSTLGAATEDIAAVRSLGFEGWIEAQFSIEPGITHEDVYRERIAGLSSDIHHAWWRQVLTGRDLLRQRMAVALTEIYVVSEVALESVPWEMMKYYDELGRLSFGNWRELLKMVTLNPVMGYYLSHLRNRKPDPELRRFPDENYAREIMQLFSIGLWRLNLDGSHERDRDGREIPTYGNAEVMNFARVFTGLGFGGPAASSRRPGDFLGSPPSYGEPMQIWEEEHDREEKLLLRGARLPAFADAPGRKAMDDVEDAIDNLFFHPNVGPFFGRLLIQRLVTSNPSPGYISRVATAFNNNGRGLRGDMKAVIKAILLDPEARQPSGDGTRAGRLHEPYLRYVRLARTFKARSAAGTFKVNDHETLESISQILLNSPSVFNFFLPDYRPSGPIAEAGLCAPEFQIMTSTTAITSLNLYGRMVAAGFGDAADGPDAMRLNFDEEIAVADQPEALIDLLDLKMACGLLSVETRKILLTAYAELPPGAAAAEKVKAIVHLIAVSPDFAVLE